MRTCYIIILLFVIITGCRTRIQYIPVKSTEVMTMHLRDTTVNTILVPYRDSVSTPDTSSYLHNPYAESWAVWSKGKLNHSLNIIPDTIPVTLQVQDIYITRQMEIPIEVERKLTKWEQFKMDAGGLAIGLLAGVILIGIGFAVVWLVRRKK